MNSPSSASIRPPRLHSLDALRGLDMLIILGLDALVLLLASRNPESAFLQEAGRQMTHAAWGGLRLYDLVFPVFVFISGVSMSFSLARHTDGNAPAAPGLLKIWKRALILALLGMLVNGTLTWTENMRYASVLGLIGFSCAIAGTCILLLRRQGSVAAAGAALFALVAVLQFTGGNFTPGGSVNSWVDTHWLPGRLHGGTFDPEGPLCIISAAALCLAGWLAGSLLRKNRERPVRFCLLTLAAGSLLFCAALALDGVYPIIKNMWTGTFILGAAGASLIALSLFHLAVDVWKGGSWAFPLRIIGLNALAAYLIHALVNVHELNRRIFSGAADFFPSVQPVFLAVSLLLLQWLVLFAFFRRSLFIKL
ncbi:acyltransferase family protein [Akkermansia sp.]|uniref:acyltransferase family protein n=1 Tax=Akkermansia sp. TaxID=1872421 RepID=UPI0025B92FB6|nr:acyltransferase family protein [Akkermansia sp.]